MSSEFLYAAGEYVDVFLIGYAPTESMEPTLERSSYIIGRRIYSSLETGDIIIFRHDGKLLVKRIAAVEGDIVERNGISITAPESCYYVLGDNTDSISKLDHNHTIFSAQ